MAVYCVAADVYFVYGKTNTNAWADLDNDNDYNVINARITTAIDYATDYLNSRLTLGPYTIPFTIPYPKTIIRMTAMYAGLMLYDGRQVVTADAPDQVSRQRMIFDMYVQQIHRGQLKLVHATTTDPLEKTAYNAPESVSWENE
jgi:hypothetical protein